MLKSGQHTPVNSQCSLIFELLQGGVQQKIIGHWWCHYLKVCENYKKKTFSRL